MKIVVMVDGQPKGPYELDALKADLQAGRISPNALAWHEGREGWTELQQIPEVQAALSGLPAASRPAPISQTAAVEPSSVKWFYLDGDQTRGPSSTEEIKALLSAGSIPPSTFVFREGLKDWAKASSLVELGTELPIDRTATDIPPCRPSKKRIVGRIVIASTVAVVCVVSVVAIQIVRKQNEAKEAQRAKQQAEQTALEKQSALQAKQEAEQRERDLKAQQEKLAAIAKERQVQEEAKRIVDEERTVRNYGVDFYSTDDTSSLDLPMEDSQPKFSRKVEYMKPWFTDVHLVVCDDLAMTLFFTNLFSVSWQVVCDPAAIGPSVTLYFAPRSRQIRQVDIFEQVAFERRGQPKFPIERHNVPSLQAVACSAMALVASNEVADVQKWLNANPLTTAPTIDMVKLQDFETVSVVLSRFLQTSVETRQTFVHILIVPRRSTFLLGPFDWTGAPPESGFRRNGYRAYVSRSEWRRFITQ